MEIIENWRERAKEIPTNDFFQRVQEARIEPKRKRLIITADFPEFNAEQLKDDMVILRLNRQVYDFLQFLNSEAWLKPYMQFYESYFLICRATKINLEGQTIFYPFMKAGMLISDLQKLEGSYFNPRRLSEIAAVAFKFGEPV